MPKCLGCAWEGEWADCEEIDYGGPEEFWGAEVWHPCITYFCPDCGLEIEDIE